MYAFLSANILKLKRLVILTTSSLPPRHFVQYPELDILGFDEYLDSGQKCFIEWPEVAIEHIFCSYVDIYIESKSIEEREITIKTID